MLKEQKEKMIMMKESTKRVITYLQGLDADDNVTAADVAEALGMEKRSVDGVFTSAIQRKELGTRVTATVELEDGTPKIVKFLKLNDDGMKLDVNAEDEE